MAAMVSRRHVVSLSLGAFLSGSSAWAVQRRSLADPLRLGVDPALLDSGLAKALQQAFARDTGIVVQLVRSPALPLLEALDRGELDAALSNAPDAEARLDKEGLVHDRHRVATGDFVIVGPATRPKTEDVLGPPLGHDAVEALGRLRDAAPGTFTFLTAADGSGTHVAEQALWRHAKIAPAAPWYVSADAGTSLIAQARARGAFALVERGAWLAQGGAPLALRVEGDPRLSEAVHVMRAFRVNHPAGKIFVSWIGGPKGSKVVAAHRGYRAGGG